MQHKTAKEDSSGQNNDGAPFKSVADVLQAQYATQHKGNTLNSPPPGELEGAVRCRFDLFVRYYKREHREKETFCYRGDHFGIVEPKKMLCSLLRFFIKENYRWYIAELYDNTKPKNDFERIVIKWNGGKILENRLNNYAPMLTDFPMPEWLKTFHQ